MANQQQDQNRPGKDRESGQQPMPGKSPGQTIPGQGNQKPGDQGKQNPRDQGNQDPRDQGKNPGMPQRDPASPASPPGTKGDPPSQQPGNYPDIPPPDVFAGEERPGRPNPPDSGRRVNPDSTRPDSGGKSGNDSSQGRK